MKYVIERNDQFYKKSGRFTDYPEAATVYDTYEEAESTIKELSINADVVEYNGKSEVLEFVVEKVYNGEKYYLASKEEIIFLKNIKKATVFYKDIPKYDGESNVIFTRIDTLEDAKKFAEEWGCDIKLLL